MNADELEVAPGAARETLEGLVFESTGDEELLSALEKAFGYRGDVTITKKDGSVVEGYVFDRRTGSTLAGSFVRLYPKNGSEKTAVSYADIAGLAFTGRDMAAGRSWAAWVKNYLAKKAAGEKNIALQPEKLD